MKEDGEEHLKYREMEMDKEKYVILTAVRNEEAHIERLIKAVLGQTVLPVRWVVISDGSTDGTDEIVKRYAQGNRLLQLLRLERRNPRRDFGGKVCAIHRGWEEIKSLDYEFIGNLDGDVSIERDYYEGILRKFEENENLGIAGGFVYEEDRGRFESRKYNTTRDVAGAGEVFRRQCFEAIGGYVPVPVGGEDTIAAVSARMKGWEVSAFPELKIYHHKKGSDVRGALRERFRDGAAGFAVGSHPVFEILKSVRRIGQRPFGISALVRLAGFCSQYCLGVERVVDGDFVKYLRGDQLKRIKWLFL